MLVIPNALVHFWTIKLHVIIIILELLNDDWHFFHNFTQGTSQEIQSTQRKSKYVDIFSL